ncbi:MAG: DUF4347 domain-containing protein, partial [Planctomycetes bacterium]|nr:DUF4347 domain-containing protein [Planctomycetota bacterium]
MSLLCKLRRQFNRANRNPVTLEHLEPRVLLSAEPNSWFTSMVDHETGMDVVLASNSLPDTETLFEAIPQGSELMLINDGDAPESILARITNLADQWELSVNSVTVLTHGSNGRFSLGSERMDTGSFDSMGQTWSELGEVMAEDGAIYIYSCNTASIDGDGLELLENIAELTGVEVRGSDDITGEGGDWELEVVVGQSEGEIASEYNPVFDAAVLAQWSGNLGSINVDYVDDGDVILENSSVGDLVAGLTSTYGTPVYSIVDSNGDAAVDPTFELFSFMDSTFLKIKTGANLDNIDYEQNTVYSMYISDSDSYQQIVLNIGNVNDA